MDSVRQLLGQPQVLVAGVSAIIVFIATKTYYHYKNVYSYWTRMGVKGPEPRLVLGHLLELFSQSRLKTDEKWLSQYGKVFGIYEASKPTLVVADAELLQQICIKDFDVFPNHDTIKFLNEYQKSFLFGQRDGDWRRVRAIITPTFTSGKIKRMFKFLDSCADDLIDLFVAQLDDITRMPQNDLGKEINLKELYSMYSMDAIATCCYGLKLERDASSASLKSAARRNEFIRMALKVFDVSYLRILAVACVNETLLRLCGFEVFPRRSIEPLADRVRALMKSRKESGRTFDDYLQLLIRARLDDEIQLDDMDTKENHHAGLTRQSLLDDQSRMVSAVVSRGSAEDTASHLSDLEVLSSAMFLLVVGLETTATLLTFCTYALAFHQDVQERLYDEVRALARYDERTKRHSFDYESLTSCQYLDSVLCETLRRFPPAIMTDRLSTADCRLDKYNIHLPKGSKVMFNLYLIMNNPEYWHQPARFDPDRFMPAHRDTIVAGSYCPFGLGPRHCVGMRFALTEAKLGLAKIIMNFRFQPVEGTRFPADAPKLNFGLNGIKRPIVQFKLRSNK